MKTKIFTLLLIFICNLTCFADEIEAQKEIEKIMDGCESGNANQCLVISHLSEKSDKTISLTYLAKACGLGSEIGCCRFGRVYHDNKQYDKARPLFEMGCNKGIMDCCNDLGLLNKDEGKFSEARKYYKIVCDSGNQVGCANIKLLDGSIKVANEAIVELHSKSNATNIKKRNSTKVSKNKLPKKEQKIVVKSNLNSERNEKEINLSDVSTKNYNLIQEKYLSILQLCIDKFGQRPEFKHGKYGFVLNLSSTGEIKKISSISMEKEQITKCLLDVLSVAKLSPYSKEYKYEYVLELVK